MNRCFLFFKSKMKQKRADDKLANAVFSQLFIITVTSSSSQCVSTQRKPAPSLSDIITLRSSCVRLNVIVTIALYYIHSIPTHIYFVRLFFSFSRQKTLKTVLWMQCGVFVVVSVRYMREKEKKSWFLHYIFLFKMVCSVFRLVCLSRSCFVCFKSSLFFEFST